MKRYIHSPILLSFLAILLFNINLLADPAVVNDIKPESNLSKKEIRQQHSRKLNLKEKIATRFIKKAVKKAKKSGIIIQLKDSTTISGSILRLSLIHI